MRIGRRPETGRTRSWVGPELVQGNIKYRKISTIF